ncbi:hypothetical protein [Streptomyces fuscichromogenes]|uniref:Uncharacterized protein n=1 Tax=Streptomyces fuscichromogenes TaxID=1324013 RepID=A0A918CXK0_9ACTN|nr:hypothetical protein [Streptomyces fuscichromogenes]GGN44721.1 hypothetical protein GCM10011578_096000 [Streptomyces fuscichromogenes]
MTDTGPLSRGQRVRVERRPTRKLASLARPRTPSQGEPWPEVWEGMLLEAFYEHEELTAVEIYGKRSSTGETRRVRFYLGNAMPFRTTVTPVDPS